VRVKCQPSVTPLIKGGRKYRLENKVVYEFGHDQKIIIHRGYIFDGASVPKFLHWFIGPMSPRVVASSLLHDAIYTDPCLLKVASYVVGGRRQPRCFTKKEADNFFMAVNKANNMDSFRTKAAYWAVRLFGRGNF